MNTEKKLFKARLTTFLVFSFTVVVPVNAQEAQWMTLHDNVPPTVRRIPVTLNFSPSNASFYSDSRQTIPMQKAEDADDWQQRFELGTLIDACQYTVLLKDTADGDFITRNSESVCMARIVRRHAQEEPEILKEGLFVAGRDIQIPLRVPADRLHIPYDKALSGELEISIYGNRPAFEARIRTTLYGTLAGSSAVEHGLLNLSITCQESLDIQNYSISLSLKQVNERETAGMTRGSISDILKLGSATLIVEKIAADSSKLVLAVLDGSLEAPDKTESRPQTQVTVEDPFPAFARVELLRRQLLTLHDLLGQAGPDGAVVLIFGDFKNMTAAPFYGGQPQPRNLSLDETMIQQLLQKDVTTPLVLAFVCRQLSLADLYEKWLGRTPDFYILSDYSDPLEVRFLTAGMEPHMYHRPPGPSTETLSGKLDFNQQAVVTALIDAKGKTVYLNSDAAGELADSLTQINRLLKEKQQGQTQD